MALPGKMHCWSVIGVNSKVSNAEEDGEAVVLRGIMDGVLCA